jgi:hypothetical protein
VEIVVTSSDVGKVRVLDGLIRPAKDFLARIDFLAESSSDIGVMGVQPPRPKALSSTVEVPWIAIVMILLLVATLGLQSNLRIPVTYPYGGNIINPVK